jgi:Arc/MetJ family transcription regulator
MRALSATTVRAAVEEALRRVVEQAHGKTRAADQIAYPGRLATTVDLDILASERMWR